MRHSAPIRIERLLSVTEELETHQMIQEMEKMSLRNERLLIAQMSLLMDDDCNTQMAVEYCSMKQQSSEKRPIKAKKVFFHLEPSLPFLFVFQITNGSATIALYQSALPSLHSGSQKNETLLFYYGHHEHLDIIVSAGFTNEGQCLNNGI